MNIITIDPGLMTGYCYARITDEKRVEYFPFQMTDDVDDLWRRFVEVRPRHIIIEDFEFRSGSRAGLNLFPVQLIGIARLYSLTAPQDHQAILYVQKASYGKAYYTDTMLKSRELYVRGIPHAMDASRHLLQWLTFGPGFQFLTGGQDFATLLTKWSTDD